VKLRWLLTAALIGFAATACGGDAPGNRTADGTLTVTSPAADAEVAWPAKVALAAEGVTIEPVGDAQVHAGAGHYHVMVDTECVKKGNAIPNDAAHIHFGSGATTLTLGAITPGKHDLCVQVADGTHIALDATTNLTITVGPVMQKAWQETANELCTPKDKAVDEQVAAFNTAHPGIIGEGPDVATAEQRTAALDDFWNFFEEIGTVSKPTNDAVLALPHPDTAPGKAAHDKLAAALKKAEVFGTQLLRDRPADIFDRLGEYDRTGPLADLNRTLDELGLYVCI
jgi:hypothetical protein